LEIEQINYQLKPFYMRLSFFSLCFVLGSALLFSSCKKDKDNKADTTYNGPEVQVGNGTAQTFATFLSTGEPKEIGVMLTKEAFTGLPSTNQLYPLEFDTKAKENMLFDHVALGLSATGHGLPPSGNIGAHFDFRFFMTTQAARLAIPAPTTSGYPAGGGFDVAPPAGYLPANYAMNAAVNQIGRHWGENVFHTGHHVDHTMILGTWDGKLTFINPIVTLPTLTGGQKQSVVFPQPQLFAKPGYYPTKYNIYKDDKERHLVTLSDFVQR
jgi:hypothetical protein